MKLLTVGATAAILAGLMTAGAANATVVFSENFSGYTLPTVNGANTAGVSSTSNNSFTTDYSFRTGTSNTGPNSMYDEGTWTIGTNPIDVHSLWVDTSGNEDPFLMLNGKAAPTTGPNAGVSPTAWESQGVTVTAGHYTYSYDILNLCCNASDPGDATALSPMQLWYTDPLGTSTRIDIGPVKTTKDTAFGWETVSGSFDIASGGIVHIGLVDQSGIPGGNDVGVDNVMLSNAVPEPASWALMIVGFGAAGAMLRRRRQGLATA